MSRSWKRFRRTITLGKKTRAYVLENGFSAVGKHVALPGDENECKREEKRYHPRDCKVPFFKDLIKVTENESFCQLGSASFAVIKVQKILSNLYEFDRIIRNYEPFRSLEKLLI